MSPAVIDVFDPPLLWKLYVIPRTHRRLANRAFAVAAPSLWNCLPDSVLAELHPKLITYFLALHFMTYHMLLLYYFSIYCIYASEQRLVMMMMMTMLAGVTCR